MNPAPNEQLLAELYNDPSVSPIKVAAEFFEEVSREPLPRGWLKRAARTANGVLRGHPHDWPDEPGNGRRVLDFGCRQGAKLESWYRRGWHVAGIDINQLAVEIARVRFPSGSFWAVDLLQTRIDERFDLILVDNVLEHLLDPLRYLERLRGLLDANGTLRIFVPNAGALSVKLFGKYSYVYWMPFHLNLFTCSTLVAALRATGFRSVQCHTFTPIGSWTHTQRQLLLQPGFDRRQKTVLDRVLSRSSLLNYGAETLSQWMGMGEELVGQASDGHSE